MKKGFSLSNFIRKYSLVAFFVVLGMLLVFLDFLTKAHVYHVFPFETCTGLSCHTLPVFHDFLGVDFAISLAFNRGAAWGVFGDFQIPLLFLRMAMIFALFIYLFFFNQTKAAMLPLVLILSGAIGNVIDFFLYGFVIDFFQFNLWGYHFPVFNLADTWITIGVGWLFLASLCRKKKYA